MAQRTCFFSENKWFSSIGFFTVSSLCLIGGVSGQDFLTAGGSGARPEFLGEAFDILAGTDNWAYGITVEQTYDSNANFSEDNAEERSTLNFLPFVSFRSDPGGGAPFRLGVDYRPKAVVEWTDLAQNNLLQRVEAFFSSKGARGDLRVYGTLREVSSGDRLAEDFVEGRVQRLGVDLSYQVASRTRALLSTQYAQTIFDEGNKSDITTFDIGTGFDWETPSGWRFGPFVRYSTQDVENNASREAYGLLMNAQYERADGLSLRARGGVEHESFDGGNNSDESSVALTGSLEVKGRFGKTWNWIGEARILTVPSVSDTSVYFTDYQLKFLATKQLITGSFGLGFDLSYTDVETVSDTTTQRDSFTRFELLGKYERPIFKERAFFKAETTYGISRGGSEWDRWTALLSVGTQF